MLNSTDLSISGILKWLAIVFGICICGMGLREILSKEAARSRTEIVRGEDAVRIGVNHVFVGFGFLVAAFCLWYFWQRHEE